MRLLVLLLLVLLAPSCVRVNWGRTSHDVPIDEGTLAELRVGSGLDECLAQLGAPLQVRERSLDSSGAGAGAALVFAWYRDRNLGLHVGVPIEDFVTPSFDYGRFDAKTKGLVLFFDAEWRLVAWRTGLLGELLDGSRRRPALVEEPPSESS